MLSSCGMAQGQVFQCASSITSESALFCSSGLRMVLLAAPSRPQHASCALHLRHRIMQRAVALSARLGRLFLWLALLRRCCWAGAAAVRGRRRACHCAAARIRRHQAASLDCCKSTLVLSPLDRSSLVPRHRSAHHSTIRRTPPITRQKQNARPPHWASSALSSSVPAFLRSCAAVPGAVGVVLAARRGVVLVRVPCSLFARRRQATGGIRIARSSVASSASQRMCHSTVEAAPTLARATSGTSRHCMGLHLATTSYHWHPSAPSLALHRPAETTRPLHHHHRLPKPPEPRNDLVNAMRQCHAMPLVLDNAMPCHAVQ